jgi:hypothetical protein
MGNNVSAAYLDETPPWDDYVGLSWRSERSRELDRLGGACRLSCDTMYFAHTRGSRCSLLDRSQPASHCSWSKLYSEASIPCGEDVFASLACSGFICE